MRNVFRLLVLCGAFLAFGTGAFAAVFNYVVDHTGDTADQACTAAAADCSFRSALQLAASDGNTTEITFLASLYGGGPATIAAGSAWASIFTGTTIAGPGSGNIVLDMNSQVDMLNTAGGSNISISGLSIKNSKTYQCIYVYGSNITINNNIISNCRTEGIAVTDNGFGPYNTVSITNNTISSFGQSGSNLEGIDVSPDAVGGYSGVTITGNTITGGLRSIRLKNISTATVSGNILNNATGASINVESGVTGLTIGGNNPSDGNTITTADLGISMSSAGTVKNNSISGAATDAIDLSGGNGSTVSNNTITNSTQYGIVVLTDNNTLSGNTITTCGNAGILFYNYLGALIAENNTATGETISGCNYGVLIDGGAGVTGNSVVDSTISTSTTAAVRATSTSGTNYLDNTSLGGGAITVTAGTIDVNYDVRAYATQSGTSTGLISSAVTYTKNGGASTSFGTTNGSGYTSYATLDSATVTSAGTSTDSYIFSSQHNIGFQTQSSTISSVNQTVTVTHPGQQYSGDDDDDDTEVIEPPVEPIVEPVVEPPLPEILGLPVLVENETQEETEEEEITLDPIVVVKHEEKVIENTEEKKIVEESVNTVITKIETIISNITSEKNEKPKVATLESTITEYRYVGEPVKLTAIGEKVIEAVANDGEDDTTDEIWQTVEDAFTENLKKATGEDNVKVLVTDLYGKDELEAEKKKAEAEGKEVWELDMNSDYDQDQISDVVALMYDIPLFNPDSDNDGYTNAEELFLGLDPKKYDKAPTVPAITNLDGQVTGQWPSFRLRGAAGETVEVFLVNADNDNKVSLGLVEIDSKNKGELNLAYPLVNGTYFAVPKGKAGFGEAVKFTVDKNVELQMPRIIGYEKLSAEEQALLKFGKFVSMLLEWREKIDPSFSVVVFVKEKIENSGLQIVTGYAEPGSVVYLTFKSVVVSSVAIADASGKFETRLYASALDLDAQRHEILAYAADDRRGLVSNMVRFITGR
ncbi:MAG: right-handed parallel beta-helix repeat-containing protein [Candidatus Gracilibacteria bacterium]